MRDVAPLPSPEMVGALKALSVWQGIEEARAALRAFWELEPELGKVGIFERLQGLVATAEVLRDGARQGLDALGVPPDDAKLLLGLTGIDVDIRGAAQRLERAIDEVPELLARKAGFGPNR